MENDNAARFLSSYNRIESQLKILYNAKPTQNFTDLVKRCTDLNLTVRRYENELIDYGKLRNAIVHRGAGIEKVIANPCDDVVSNIEFIEMQVCCPPKITDAFKIKKIASVFADKPLLTAVDEFAEKWQKTVIVYDHGRMIGIINCYVLYKTIAELAASGEDVTKFLTEKTCRDLVDPDQLKKYCLMNAETTVLDVFTAFEKKKGLIAVIITKNGVLGEKALSIVTPADFPRINKYLENYNVKTF